jgi:NAD(P)-dependent dehydrogenase (short-subunit alcohol dehydrogenase family)
MNIRNAYVFVTGANRGLGLALVREALSRGARKVYAAARDPRAIAMEGVIPVRLDVTRPEDSAAAARACGDVDIVINNAGIALSGGFLRDAGVDDMRAMLETNFFGTLHVSRAFAPVLARNGGGAILNVLSVSTWISAQRLAAYGASKTAAWSLTNGLRLELASQGTTVSALHVGFMDTDLTREFDAPKHAPEAIARIAFDGLADGATEILADDLTRNVHAGLTATPPMYLQARKA